MTRFRVNIFASPRRLRARRTTTILLVCYGALFVRSRAARLKGPPARSVSSRRDVRRRVGRFLFAVHSKAIFLLPSTRSTPVAHRQFKFGCALKPTRFQKRRSSRRWPLCQRILLCYYGVVIGVWAQITAKIV